ncbi:hypothetical protein JCM11641_001945 [Rhodosporidiobolus odoratus]
MSVSPQLPSYEAWQSAVTDLWTYFERDHLIFRPDLGDLVRSVRLVGWDAWVDRLNHRTLPKERFDRLTALGRQDLIEEMRSMQSLVGPRRMLGRRCQTISELPCLNILMVQPHNASNGFARLLVVLQVAEIVGIASRLHRVAPPDPADTPELRFRWIVLEHIRGDRWRTMRLRDQRSFVEELMQVKKWVAGTRTTGDNLLVHNLNKPFPPNRITANSQPASVANPPPPNRITANSQPASVANPPPPNRITANSQPASVANPPPHRQQPHLIPAQPYLAPPRDAHPHTLVQPDPRPPQLQQALTTLDARLIEYRPAETELFRQALRFEMTRNVPWRDQDEQEVARRLCEVAKDVAERVPLPQWPIGPFWEAVALANRNAARQLQSLGAPHLSYRQGRIYGHAATSSAL